MSQRQKFLGIAFLAVLLGVGVYHWFSGRDLVTLDFDNTPAGKVIKALEWKAGIKIVTNGDLTAPITIHLKNAPVYEAADTLAVRMGGDLRVGYIGAQQSSQINGALAAFASNENPGGWTTFASGGGWGGGGGGQGGGPNAGGQRRGNNRPSGNDTNAAAPAADNQAPSGGEQRGGNRNAGGRGPGGGGGGGEGFGGGGMDFGTGDPRFIDWTISDMTDRNLQAFYNQGYQKTGALFAVPTEWNPVLGKLPKSAQTRDMAKAIASAGKGSVQEVFLITVNQRPGQQVADEQRPSFTPNIFSPQRGPGRNPEWTAERMQAQIAALPPEEKIAAQKDMDTMKAFRESLRNLTDEERRAKWEELMKSPEVQERMEERQAARDAKNSPEQRDNRARNYLERKQSIKGSL